MVDHIGSIDVEKLTIEDLFSKLDSSPQGLTAEEARRRLAQFGRNALEEKTPHPLLKLLSYFHGPIPWMIEAAALLSALVRHWADVAIIMVLLIFNALIGFWQEFKAANALEALKRQLALKAHVLRDGQWSDIDAGELVPGDVVRLHLGDIIPADAALSEGDFLSVDQSALTGESLPVDKKAGEPVYAGSIARQGAMSALVTATGNATFFGRTAKLVRGAGAPSHFQKAVLTIGDYLIYVSLALISVLLLVELYRGIPFLELVQFALILTVASIPVAMPAVLSVTMAVGALSLSKMKAIVSRLQSIEEMAGIDVLCTDKTGTLTQNILTLGLPAIFEAPDAESVVLTAALASRTDDRDAIDHAVVAALSKPDMLNVYTQTHFTPFDPISKRTEATIRAESNTTYNVSKGAPQVMLKLCSVDAATERRAQQQVEEYAARGFRTLGVARTDSAGIWKFMGLLPMFDPPREDSLDTLQRAKEHGISVKMVTGDNVAIARETATQLHLGNNILPAEALFDKDGTMPGDTATRIEETDGFAQVFPEHKYGIVKALQERGHLVAMTGDGVNDAPALKQADVGIAVSGATDAARAAADLILTAPGLSTIIHAIEGARRIFERMNAYAIYRVTETIRIMIFMVLAMIVFNTYPITAIMIILLALLNDLPIMAIAVDNTWLDPSPVRWQMHRVLTLATVLGLIGVVETFLLLIIAKSWMALPIAEIQTLIFLKLSIAGHLTLFVARTRRPMYTRPYPAALLLGAILGTQTIAALLAGFGLLVAPIPWRYVAFVWAYCLIWVVVEDLVKLVVYRHLDRNTPRHRDFLSTLGKNLHFPDQ